MKVRIIIISWISNFSIYIYYFLVIFEINKWIKYKGIKIKLFSVLNHYFLSNLLFSYHEISFNFYAMMVFPGHVHNWPLRQLLIG